ncbi:hypothetical protein MLD38_012892 [Melastoma candidum]|uniref:Uncharacterized protein n=1 Tax=Melastoma candidum TaxID=119954 RepID=A0ACB9RAW8_9MYRT|nr:hypothetical protein MLD38_012892 [Melastoma candidum]
MGSACCVAAKDPTLPSQTSAETIHRSLIYSPSWSFHWDNRRRVAGEVDDSYDPSDGISSHSQMHLKESFRPGRGYASDGRSQVATMGSPVSQRSPVHEMIGARSLTFSSDFSGASNDSVELKNVPSPESAAPKKSFGSTLSSSFSMPLMDNSSSRTHSIPPNSTSSLGLPSPGHQFNRQISDSRVTEMKSPCSNSVSEGRPSFALSPCSNGFTGGSQGGFSDGWSMRTFSELVASSQKERWSFDSEQLSSACGKISESSSRLSCSPSFELQTCAVCTKHLTESASYNCGSNEVSVVAVLVCGHLYHGECLEILTLDTDRYDPVCPICTMGEKRMMKMCKKALRAEAERKSRRHKIFKKRSVDGFFSGELKSSNYGKRTERDQKAPRLEASSSSKSSSTKPFLSRHFSLGSRWGRFLSENNSGKKKSFWSRYRKD